MRLLIDGDILAYKACTSAETAVDWGDGLWTLHCWEEEVQAKIKDEIALLQELTDIEMFDIAISSKNNFRKQIVDPSYKSNRANVRKPVCLKAIQEWLMNTYDAIMFDGLEADDVMGILGSKNTEFVLVSEDKDMKTIPCQLYNHKTQAVDIITKPEADYNFMLQTLTGDATDGYSGCPKVGPKTAEKILATDEERTLDWMWFKVVEAYKKAGFGEEYALTQARLARILRWREYNGHVKLWTPPDISGHYRS